MRPAEVVIVGQGLAGSLLGWECDRRGIPFHIVDPGHATAASRVGAGLISPLTGRRLAPTWRYESWQPVALAAYRCLERELGVSLVRELRILRRPRDGAEWRQWEERLGDPAVRRWIERSGPDGVWLAGGGRIDTAALIGALRARWQASGRLREERYPAPDRVEAESGAVVWCVGAEVAPGFEFVPWERSRGDVLVGRSPGARPPGILVNDGEWTFTDEAGRCWVGATFDRTADARDPVAAERARRHLQAAAVRLLGTELAETEQLAARRVTTPDRRPVLGWHPARPGWGIFAGLAAKGALWAPALAAQGADVLAGGPPVEAAVDVSRFWRS